jgi:hypothetical protein
MDLLNLQRPDNEKLSLWGLVDGVGYAENKADTVNILLADLHQFIQMKSLFKVACILHRLGICRIQALCLPENRYSDASRQQMFDRYLPADVRGLSSNDTADPAWRAIPAGFGTVYV